jgi:hypothetical protein
MARRLNERELTAGQASVKVALTGTLQIGSKILGQHQRKRKLESSATRCFHSPTDGRTEQAVGYLLSLPAERSDALNGLARKSRRALVAASRKDLVRPSPE